MAMTNEQLTKWIDEIFGTIDEIKTNSGDITTLTKDVSDLKKQTAGTVSLAKAQLQHFTDGSATQALDLVADIIPVQAGSGDPSPTNVRAISGYSSVTATAAGKNIANPSLLLNGFTSPDTGIYAYNALSKTQVVSTKGLDKITVNCTGGNRCSVAYFDEVPTDGDPAASDVSVYGVLPKTIEVDTSHAYIAIQLAYNVTPSQIQVEIGETATPYEAYQANTATLSLGRTIYGGSADFTTGAETETLVGENIGTSTAITWEDAPALHAQGVFPFTISGADYATESWMAEKYKIVYGNNWEVENGQIKVTVTAVGSVGCRLCDTTYTTLEALKTALTGSMLIHPITTPNTYTTTPAQLQLLQGENNVSATSGPITLTYAPDNVLAEVYAYIQKRFDTLTASLAANRTTRKTTKNTDQKGGLTNGRH